MIISGTNPTYSNQKLTSFNGESITYSNGYMTKYGNRNITFANNKLMSYNNTTFSYDGLGRRTNKISNGTTTRYAYEGNKLVKESRPWELIEYLYGADGIIGFIIEDSTYFSGQSYNPLAWNIPSQNFANQVHYGETVRAILYYPGMRETAIWFSEEVILLQRLAEIIRGGL